MPLDRFYIPTAGLTDKLHVLECGFMWLLKRPETELHIAFHRAETLVEVLDDLPKAKPNLAPTLMKLKEDRVLSLGNGVRITCAPTRPSPQARPNGPV